MPYVGEQNWIRQEVVVGGTTQAGPNTYLAGDEHGHRVRDVIPREAADLHQVVFVVVAVAVPVHARPAGDRDAVRFGGRHIGHVFLRPTGRPGAVAGERLAVHWGLGRVTGEGSTVRRGALSLRLRWALTATLTTTFRRVERTTQRVVPRRGLFRTGIPAVGT